MRFSQIGAAGRAVLRLSCRPSGGVAEIVPADGCAGCGRSEKRKSATLKGRGFRVELPGFEPRIILLIINVLCGMYCPGPTIRPFVSKYDVP